MHEIVSGESSQPFIFSLLLSSSISVCAEDELGMTEALRRLLVEGKGRGRERNGLRDSLTLDDLTGLI